MLLRQVVLRFGLEPGFYGAVLIIKIRHVRYEVLDDVHVRKWVNLCCLAAVINLADAGKGVHTTDVHGAAAADTLTARPENWERVL